MTARLAYCTNVAPMTDLDGLVASLRGLWTDVRQRLHPDASDEQPLGLGIWFPDELAANLANDRAAQDRLRDTLAELRLELVTVNAFPMREFHAPVVKEGVYLPHWMQDERDTYTRNVAAAVAGILPRGSDLTLSTLPIRYPKQDADALAIAAQRLTALSGHLAELEDRTGTVVRVALEPEPCCALETTDEAIAFFGDHLATRAPAHLIRRYLGVCLDLCHTCVAHEDPIDALARYGKAEVSVHKIQVSAALEVPEPDDSDQRALVAQFVEPRWLHQVGRGPGDVVLDLPQALADEAATGPGPWRVHFHVPLHAENVGGLPTTRSTVQRTLEHVGKMPQPPVLELETYTWSVVPGASDDLAQNVANEIAWVRDVLAAV